MATLERFVVANEQIVGGRKNQQDYFSTQIIEDGLLVLLADGMGGYLGGEIASETAVKTFSHLFKLFFKEFTIPDLMIKVLYDTQAVISQSAQNNPDYADMGTTFIAAYFKENRLYYVSVGDSPMYQLYNGEFKRINTNHSLAAQFAKDVENGIMTKEEAEMHPDRHVITSALMIEDIPEVDFRNVPLEFDKGSIFVLASDGVHTISDATIQEFVMAEAPLHIKGEALISAIEAKEQPHQDNTTIVLVEYK